MYILEKMIETRLSVSFDNSAIEEFYANFKDNMGKYEAANKDGFDTLFGFIDFDKFKANILRYKADHKKVNEEEGSTASDSDNASLGHQDENIFWELIKEDIDDKKFGWKKSLEMKITPKNPVSCIMYQRPMPNMKGINMVRTDITFKDVQAQAFESFMKSFTEGGGEEIENVKKFEVFDKKSTDDMKFYILSKIPMMTDRENLVHWTRKTMPDGKKLVV